MSSHRVSSLWLGCVLLIHSCLKYFVIIIWVAWNASCFPQSLVILGYQGDALSGQGKNFVGTFCIFFAQDLNFSCHRMKGFLVDDFYICETPVYSCHVLHRWLWFISKITVLDRLTCKFPWLLRSSSIPSVFFSGYRPYCLDRHVFKDLSSRSTSLIEFSVDRFVNEDSSAWSPLVRLDRLSYCILARSAIYVTGSINKNNFIMFKELTIVYLLDTLFTVEQFHNHLACWP